MIAFLAVTACFGLYVWLRWPRPSLPPDVVARRAMEAFVNGDYATLLGYVNEEEKELLNLNEESLAECVNRLYKPNTKGFKPSGEVVLHQASERDALAMQGYTHPDGRKFQVSILVAAGERDAEVYGLVFFLVQASLHAKMPPEVVSAGGPAFRQGLLEAFEEELPVLTSLKIPGDTVSGDGRQIFRSWDDMHKHFKERASRSASSAR
ncbi:MAG: hypothetical protein AB1725_11360 [Armatimonadota bacterium]